MEAVVKSWKFLLLTAMLAAAALSGPGNGWAEPGHKMPGRAVADLTALRDHLADNWARLLKSGWNVYADDKLLLQDVEKKLAAFRPWLDAVPPESLLKVERLTKTISRILKAEAAYRASIEQCRNSMAQSLLGLITMTQIGGSITAKTDALVLGFKPVYLSADPEALKNLGFKPDSNVGFRADPPGNHEAAAVESVELPASPAVKGQPVAEKEPVEPPPVGWGPQPVEPSSDPKVLRAAYEAYKAYQSLRFMLTSAGYDVQLAMAEFTTMPAHLGYSPKYLEEALIPLRQLPGLTERELKAIDDLPQFFQETEDRLKLAGDALAQKQQAQADLEELVESALADIDELRAGCLKRLVEQGR